MSCQKCGCEAHDTEPCWTCACGHGVDFTVRDDRDGSEEIAAEIPVPYSGPAGRQKARLVKRGKAQFSQNRKAALKRVFEILQQAGPNGISLNDLAAAAGTSITSATSHVADLAELGVRMSRQQMIVRTRGPRPVFWSMEGEPQVLPKALL